MARVAIAVLFLASSPACLGSQPGVANLEWWVDCFEINTYGGGESTTTQVLFRDHTGRIVAWRYYRPELRPVLLPTGEYVAHWEDLIEGRQLLTVRGRQVIRTRTLEDKWITEMQNGTSPPPRQHSFRRPKPPAIKTDEM